MVNCGGLNLLLFEVWYVIVRMQNCVDYGLHTYTGVVTLIKYLTVLFVGFSLQVTKNLIKICTFHKVPTLLESAAQISVT